MSFFNTPWKFNSLPLKNRAFPRRKAIKSEPTRNKFRGELAGTRFREGIPVLHGCTGPNLTYPKHDGFPKMYLRLETWVIFSQPTKHHLSFSAYTREKYGHVTWQWKIPIIEDVSSIFRKIGDFPARSSFQDFVRGLYVTTFQKITQPSIPSLAADHLLVALLKASISLATELP